MRGSSARVVGAQRPSPTRSPADLERWREIWLFLLFLPFFLLFCLLSFRKVAKSSCSLLFCCSLLFFPPFPFLTVLARANPKLAARALGLPRRRLPLPAGSLPSFPPPSVSALRARRACPPAGPRPWIRPRPWTNRPRSRRPASSGPLGGYISAWTSSCELDRRAKVGFARRKTRNETNKSAKYTWRSGCAKRQSFWNFYPAFPPAARERPFSQRP